MKTSGHWRSCCCSQRRRLAVRMRRTTLPVPVRILVPLAAGGGMDTVTRSLSERLGESLGQSFVVDNRPGAGSQIALDILSQAAPDGYTLMMISATTVVHPILYKSRFDIVRDFRAGLAGDGAGLRARGAPSGARQVRRRIRAVPARESGQAQLQLVGG